MSTTAPEVVQLALLDGYKVRWSRETVARDIVQNFFDEVEDFDDVDVEVDEEAGTVRVHGPSVFDLEYLKYIGATTKTTRRTAGGFGEGFKVCALVLLRDYRCKVTAGSGTWEMEPRLVPMKLGRELCYEVRRRSAADAYPGSFVLLEGADARLCEAFDGAKDLFRHPYNPRLQRPIYADEAAGIGVYTASDPRAGDLFYRRQHRGYVRFAKGAALSFAYDDRHAAIEGDRDRRDLSAAMPLIAAIARGLPDAELQRLVLHLRAYWAQGNRVLATLIAEAARRGLRMAFPRRWLARVKHGYHLERHAERRGFHLGVERLAAIGMPSLEDRFGAAQEPRAATAVEAARVVVARDLYTRLAGEPPIFSRFRVVDLEARGGDYRSASCTVASKDLAAPFGDGIAPTLARLACGAGLRSRRNADRLTSLLRGAMVQAGTLAPYAERWAEAAVDPSREAVDPSLLGRPGEEDDDALRTRRPRLPIAVLAPAGFPPAEALLERIKALCHEARVMPCQVGERVGGPRAAALAYARGVPSVWIGASEIEPDRTRPRYALRTFAGSDGARALVPTDDVLREVIAAEASIVRRGSNAYRTGNRNQLGRGEIARWLRAHAPDEYRELLVTRAISSASAGWPRQPAELPYEIDACASNAARRALAAFECDDEDLEDEAICELEDAHEAVTEMMRAILERAPGILADEPPTRAALRALLAHVDVAVAAGATEEDARAASVEAAARAVTISGWSEAAPLDAHCAAACAAEALCRYWEIAAERGPDAGLEAARERFDLVVEHALGRHEQRDADDQAPSCWNLALELRARYGRGPQVIASDPSAEAKAVREAWDQARAAGLTEMEAAARCLEAALPFDVSPPNLH